MLLRHARNAISCYARTRNTFRFCSVLVDGAEERNCRRDDAELLALLLKQSASAKNLHDGRLLHFLLAHHHLDGLLHDNRLLCMYAKCGASCDACALFDSIHQTDPQSWRFVMRARASDAEECKQIFQQMMIEGILPVKVTLITILSTYADAVRRSDGMRMHASIECTELILDMEVGNTILNMYCSCESFNLANVFYEGMPWHHVITFNTMIGAAIRQDNSNKALYLFEQMQCQAVIPSGVTFISIVSACTSGASLAKGKEMHACVMGSEFVPDIVLMNALLNMYGKLGDLTYAERLFWEMPKQDAATWNCFINSLIQHERERDALQVFQHMSFMGPFSNDVTVLNTLAACGCKEDLTNVKQLHLRVVGAKSESDVVLGTAIVNAYSRCGDLESAARVFTTMSSWDVILCNAMIKAYVNHGKNGEAIEFLQVMQGKGVFPTKATMIIVLDTYTILEEGKQIHELISRHGLETDSVVGTGLLNMYNRCGSLEDVQKVFGNMQQHDLVSWNAFLAAVAQHSLKTDIVCRFQMMLFEGVFPDNITFTSLFDGCKNSVGSKEALWIHTLFIHSNLSRNTHDTNCIINMYGSCGHLKHARRAFEEGEDRDNISWNVLIAAYSQAKQSMEALSIFRQMQIEGLLQDNYTLINLLSGFADAMSVLEGKRVHATIIGSPLEENIGIINSLLHLFVLYGKLNDAWKLFDTTVDRDIVSWNVMLAAYGQWEEPKEAFPTFQRMSLECILPDKVTLTCMVCACTSQEKLAKGKQMHVRILENDFKCDVTLMNAIITMYGKSGSLEDASKTFGDLCACNVVSWSAIIAAYALHGRGEEALQLYARMQQDSMVPNKVTYLVILCACSHSGLLREGLECFISMIQDSGIKPTQNHLDSIIDLLGRAGLLDAAETLLNLHPTSFSWNTLLSICRMHCDIARGERVARHALLLEPDNVVLYVLLSNLYSLSEV